MATINKVPPMEQTAKMTNGARLFWRSLLSRDLYEPNAIAAVLPHLTDEDLWLSAAQAKNLLKGDGLKASHLSKIEEKFKKIYTESFQCQPDWWLDALKSTDDDATQNEDWNNRKALLSSLRPPLAVKIRLALKSKRMLFFTEEESRFFEHRHAGLVSSLTQENRAWFAEKALEQREYGTFFALRQAAGNLSKMWEGYTPFCDRVSRKIPITPEILFGVWFNTDDKSIKAKQNFWSHIRKAEGWNLETNLSVLSASPVWVEAFLRYGNREAWENIFNPTELSDPKVEEFLWSRALSSTWRKDAESCFARAKNLLEHNVNLPDVPWPNEFFVSINGAEDSNRFRFYLLPRLLKKAKESNHRWFSGISDKVCGDIATALLVNDVNGSDKNKINLMVSLDNLLDLTGRNTWVDMPFGKKVSAFRSVSAPGWTLLRQATEFKDQDLFRWCLENGADVDKKLPEFSVDYILQKRKVSLKTLCSTLTEFKLRGICDAPRKAKVKV